MGAIPAVSPFRYVAPAGAPIGLADLVHWATLGVSGDDVLDRFRQTVSDRFAVRHSVLTSSGRAGLTLVLRALQRLAPADRDEVILPSYTCFSVAAAIVKAGLRPRIVDISPDTLDYAQDELANTDFARVLAIVATSLYGIPSDLPAIESMARRHGVFLIDDAAQAMGASVGGRLCGTWGDAGIFSFDKGKNVSAIKGGVVLTNSDEIASALRKEMAGLRSPGIAQSTGGVLTALSSFVFLHSRLYWIPNRIPQLGLGTTKYSTDFPLEFPSRTLVALALVMIDHLEEFTRTRRANAAALLGRLRDVRGIRTITPPPSSVPVYVRLPILLADENARRRALAALNAAGVGGSGSYPTSIADIVDLRGVRTGSSCDRGGRQVAQRILTIPTHAFVTAADVGRMISAIAKEAIEPAPRVAITT